MDRIILKKGREASLLRFHPWVFSGAVASISGNPSEGDLVEVFSSGGEFLATGHYQKGSITVRVLSFEPGKIGDSFWEDSIRQALQAREAAGLFEAVIENGTAELYDLRLGNVRPDQREDVLDDIRERKDPAFLGGIRKGNEFADG